jgi:hypothetical protein
MTTARSILHDLAAFTDLDLPVCRHARMAFAYAKMCQWQLTKKKDIKAAMRCAASATRALARSLEDAAKAAQEVIDDGYQERMAAAGELLDGLAGRG